MHSDIYYIIQHVYTMRNIGLAKHDIIPGLPDAEVA